MDSKHTPTPWTFGHSQNDNIGDITDKDGCLIADTYSNNAFDGMTCIENARFIIRAVNNHDDILKALRFAKECFRGRLADEGYKWEGEDCKIIDAAISKAEGKVK